MLLLGTTLGGDHGRGADPRLILASERMRNEEDSRVRVNGAGPRRGTEGIDRDRDRDTVSDFDSPETVPVLVEADDAP